MTVSCYHATNQNNLTTVSNPPSKYVAMDADEQDYYTDQMVPV